MKLRSLLAATAVVLAACPVAGFAHEAHKPHTGGITSQATKGAPADYDIVHTKITTQGKVAIFHMAVSGKAGKLTPKPGGKLAGSEVFSYVWPTTLDPYEVGFEHKAGILALAVTAHPDFDDTPLYDENKDGKKDNDGYLWHTHWVVLGPDEVCGPGALKVIDIPEGTKPRLPATWPQLPILIDSPDIPPSLKDDTIEVKVPFENIGAVEALSFDGVTAVLRVNANVHAPLLCVVNVWDVASGNLSLPGKVNK